MSVRPASAASTRSVFSSNSPPSRASSGSGSQSSTSISPFVSTTPHLQNQLVTSCALDKEWLVLGLSTSQVSVYGTRTGELLRTLIGHKSGIWAVALVSRGGRPWTAPSSEAERDARSFGDSQGAYFGQRSRVSNAAEGWGQRSALVVSGGSDRLVAVWDLVTGKCLHTMKGHTATIRCIKTLHNRPIAISGARDATLRVWDLNRGRLIRALVGHQDGISCIEACGNRVVSGSYDSTCRIWNIDSGECMAVLTGHTDRIYSLSFDGLLLASGSLDGTTRIWDATSSLCLQTLVSSQAAVTNVVISPTSTVLACGSSDGTVVIYSLVPSDNFRVVQAIAPHQSSITGLQFEDSEQHLILLTSGSDGWIRRFDAVNGKFLREFCDHADTVWKVVACVDVCGVVSQKGGRTVVDVWSTRTPPSMIE